MGRPVKTGCMVTNPNTGADIVVEVTHELPDDLDDINETELIAIQEVVKNAIEKLATIEGFSVLCPMAMMYPLNGTPSRSI